MVSGQCRRSRHGGTLRHLGPSSSAISQPTQGLPDGLAQSGDANSIVSDCASELAEFENPAMSALGVRRGKAALFQWVEVPPGDRSTRKQPEPHRGDQMAEAFGIACHALVSLNFRCGSGPDHQAARLASPLTGVEQTKFLES